GGHLPGGKHFPVVPVDSGGTDPVFPHETVQKKARPRPLLPVDEPEPAAGHIVRAGKTRGDALRHDPAAGTRGQAEAETLLPRPAKTRGIALRHEPAEGKRGQAEEENLLPRQKPPPPTPVLHAVPLIPQVNGRHVTPSPREGVKAAQAADAGRRQAEGEAFPPD